MTPLLIRPLLCAPVLAALVLLAGCASVPPPNAAMSRAKANVQAAKEAGAADADPVDLNFAQGKLGQAQAAMTAGKYAVAAHRADESLADSNLALTKARLARVRDQIHKQGEQNARLRAQFEHDKAAARPKPKASDADTRELPETVLPSAAMPASTAPAPTSSTVQEGN